MDIINEHIISSWIFNLGIWPLLVMLVINMMFRRYGSASGYKRMASLYHAIAVFFITTAAAYIADRELSDIYLFVAIALTIVVLFIFRKKTFPYSRNCTRCNAKVDFRTMYFLNDNLCADCRETSSKNVGKEVGEESGDAGSAENVTSKNNIEETKDYSNDT